VNAHWHKVGIWATAHEGLGVDPRLLARHKCGCRSVVLSLTDGLGARKCWNVFGCLVIFSLHEYNMVCKVKQ
jgi:hypothetical protein